MAPQAKSVSCLVTLSMSVSFQTLLPLACSGKGVPPVASQATSGSLTLLREEAAPPTLPRCL